jgi:hypothetical protein
MDRYPFVRSADTGIVRRIPGIWVPSTTSRKESVMGIGASVFLLALGAIFAFAVDAEVAGIDIQTIGMILMVAGVIGLIWTLVVWGPRRRVTRERVVDDGTV